MKQYLAGRIRNIALTGHSDSGKTSLAEALLFKAGASDRLGKISEGNTVCDFDPEEIKRQVSVSTSIAPFAWGSTKINLIDTPGLFDFAGEAAEGARAVESLLITVSGKSGVDVGTEKAYKMAKDASKATMFFVSKLDVEHSDFYKVFEELKATFGPTVCPIVVPYVEDQKVQSYINLIDMKAYTYDEKGEPHEVDMPDFGHRLDGLTAAVSEAVAETDEALFEKYFSGEQFTRDEIIRGVHTGVTNGSISPVLCGCSSNLQGIDMLLDCIVDLLPSPWEKGGEVAVDAEGETVEDVLTDAIHTLGENMNLARAAVVEAGGVASYIHGGGKIGVLVEFAFNNAETAQNEAFKTFAHDVALQVAAVAPICATRDQVPAETVEHEKQIYMAQAAESGKPEAIQEKMAVGRLEKFYKQSVLTEQEFIKDSSLTIKKYAEQVSKELGDTITVVAFDRLVRGE